MAEDKKFCPLLFAVTELPEIASFCLKEKCAWWDDIAGSCAILVIAQFGEEGSFYVQRQEQKESINRGKGG